MDSTIPIIETKQTGTESAACHEESDNWNQCAEWNIYVRTEWIDSVGESGDHERWTVQWKWQTASDELCKTDKH